ncbi:MAG: hypothetical protein ACRDSF_25675, partial [Pseudonocardiaceae bacterium]
MYNKLYATGDTGGEGVSVGAGLGIFSRVVSHDPAPDQIAAYLDWYFDRNPVHADALGAPGYSHRLGDFSATAFDSREREVSGWLSRFEAEPVGIDRDLVVSVLRGELLMAGWPAW